MTDETKKPALDIDRLDAELESKGGEEEGQHQVSESEKKLVDLAKKQYTAYMEVFSGEIQDAKDDNAFVGGDHWTVTEGGKAVDVKALRDADGKISFTKNRAPGFIDNVTGDVRQNMPRIKFRPQDSKTDPKLADIYNAAIQYMQSISRAHRQYIPAFEQACTSGYPGWCQIITDYSDPETSKEQDIFVKFIPSQFGPALDHNAIALDEPGRGGPKWGIIPEDISWADYIARFPKASVRSWEEVKDSGNDWYDKDMLTIASWYRAVPEQKKSETTGLTYTKWRIDHYLINGSEILAGPEPWAGKFIPLIPFEGKWYIDNGKKRYRSVYREAKDANRQENYFASEITMQLADEPYIADPDMIAEEHKDSWMSRNKKKFGVLFAKVVNGLLPRKEDNSSKLSGMFHMVQQTIDDEKGLTNIYNASQGATSNETSGRAINARDQQSNTTNFAFVDNGIIAPLEYIAMQFVDLFPKIYDYEKTLTILGDDDKPNGEVTVNATVPGGEIGTEPQTAHIIKDKHGDIVKQLFTDMSKVKFNIIVEVGPGMKTQRMEAVDQMIRMSQGNPVYAEASSAETARMLDHPGSDAISKKMDFILNLKYPGINEAAAEDEGDKQASIQKAVQQATEQLQQQMMPVMQQSADKIEQMTQEMAQKDQQLQMATEAMKDMTVKMELRLQKQALDQQMKDMETEKRILVTEAKAMESDLRAKEASGPMESFDAVQELQQQIAELAHVVEEVHAASQAIPEKEQPIAMRKTGIITAENGRKYNVDIVSQPVERTEGGA
ncbi:MAG TPA: hypothetical protein PL001_01160 [Candidatus Kryptobacter bacterium]|nr:hypothetical protein [Candidatus Kryptobacter bacterium]